MNLKRIQDLSIYYWLQSKVPSIVNVEDGFPTGSLTLPTVSITSLDIRGVPLELGGCDYNTSFWRIDIFAKNKAQRDELAYLLFDEIEHQVPVYDYGVGFPPAISPPQIGTLIVSKRLLRPVHVFEELVEKLYWRSSVTFFTYYEQI